MQTYIANLRTRVKTMGSKLRRKHKTSELLEFRLFLAQWNSAWLNFFENSIPLAILDAGHE